MTLTCPVCGLTQVVLEGQRAWHHGQEMVTDAVGAPSSPVEPVSRRGRGKAAP